MIEKSTSKSVFMPRDLVKLYADQKMDELGKAWIFWLNAFAENKIIPDQPQTKLLAEHLISSILYFMPTVDFLPTSDTVLRLISYNTTIACLIEQTSVKSPDSVLDLIDRIYEKRAKGFWKTLIVLSPLASRYRELIPERAHPALLAVWFHKQFDQVKYAASDATSIEKIRSIVPMAKAIGQHGDFLATEFSPHSMFAVTYAAPDQQDMVKRPIGEAVATVAKRLAPVAITTPTPRAIAVVTGPVWRENASVWRDQYALLAALSKKFELTLINTAPAGFQLDETLFRHVVRFTHSEGGNGLRFPLVGEFEMAYYPEYGMNYGAVLLANHRVAPIQITSYGHPVSSHSEQMDYFIASGDVESNASDPALRFSERLVLLPGRAVAPMPINAPRGQGARHPGRNGELPILHCGWTAMKISHQGLAVLRRLAERVRYQLRFRFTPALQASHPVLPLLSHRIRSALPGLAIDILPLLKPPQYRSILADATLAADSIPFGGSNTIVDAIHFGLPIVCHMGAQEWYSRIGAAHLRRIDCSELIAQDEDEYIEILARLIEDEAWHSQIVQKITAAHLETTLYRAEDEDAFVEAFETILVNHDQWKNSDDRSPIWIGGVPASVDASKPKQKTRRAKTTQPVGISAEKDSGGSGKKNGAKARTATKRKPSAQVVAPA